MRTSTRLSVLTPLLVSSLAIGPVAFAQVPDADARVPAAGTCKVSADGYGDPGEQRITGSGFGHGGTVAVVGSGGYDGKVLVGEAGDVRVGKLPPGTYTVDGVPCDGGGASEPDGQQKPDANARAEYDKGFQAGFRAVKADCQAKPPQTALPPDQNWTDGYNAGAALAAKTFCGG